VGVDGFYRVRVGAFASPDDAARAATALRTQQGAPVRTLAEHSSVPSPFRLQVAALSRADRARTVLERLQALGYDAYLLPPQPGGADALYRVRTGAFATRDEAQAVATAIGRAMSVSVWITRDQPALAPVRRPAARQPRGRAAAPTFAIQLGALARPEGAEVLRARMAELGYVPYVVPPAAGETPALYRVRVGGYPSRADANRAAPLIERAIGARVWVTEETARPARATVAPTPGSYNVQVAAFTEPSRAEQLVEQLKGLGYSPYLRLPRADAWYRVGAGPYETLDAARAAAATLERQLGIKVWIVPAAGGQE
jgi:cell division septation protein DedD